MNIADELSSLRRPRLLIRAARFAVSDYQRERDLQRLTGIGKTPGSTAALSLLMEAEATQEAARKDGRATYSVTRHVALLSALMGEARLQSRTSA